MYTPSLNQRSIMLHFLKCHKYYWTFKCYNLLGKHRLGLKIFVSFSLSLETFIEEKLFFF